MDSNRILSERVVHTDAYTHDTQTLAHCTHTHTYAVLFFSLKHNQGLGGISWVEYFRRTVLFWSPAVRRLKSFYFKENILQLFSLISHFSFFHNYLPQGFSKPFPSVPPYLSVKKKQQMTVQIDTNTHQALNDWHLQNFFSFFERQPLNRKTRITCYLCLNATYHHTSR